ncbi:MAG TPA: hypothetical protein DD457_07705, partial [Gammaproteobacteria bacterium]|nr:hypothetical protein [Gammaproteobacteria bacterium]
MFSVSARAAVGKEDHSVDAPGTIALVWVGEVNRATVMESHRAAWYGNELRCDAASLITIFKVKTCPREDVSDR